VDDVRAGAGDEDHVDRERGGDRGEGAGVLRGQDVVHPFGAGRPARQSPAAQGGDRVGVGAV
jgi:hypothetical protein